MNLKNYKICISFELILNFIQSKDWIQSKLWKWRSENVNEWIFNFGTQFKLKKKKAD